MEALDRALNLSKSEGYCRSFVDLGPEMQVLLKLLIRIQPTPYLAAILGAFPESKGSTAASERLKGTVNSLWENEAFNVRELGVLRLLGLSNTHKQIARELQLSPNTVRWHMQNLYTKLKVNSRTETLNRARELKLV